MSPSEAVAFVAIRSYFFGWFGGLGDGFPPEVPDVEFSAGLELGGGALALPCEGELTGPLGTSSLAAAASLAVAPVRPTDTRTRTIINCRNISTRIVAAAL